MRPAIEFGSKRRRHATAAVITIYVSDSYSSTPSRGCRGFFVYTVGVYCTLQAANKINL
jgi:hypothetical protein